MNPANATDIVGEWSVTGIDYSGTSTTFVQSTSVTADFTGTGVDMDLEIEFTESPNNYLTQGDYSIDLTTEVQGQSFEFR